MRKLGKISRGWSLRIGSQSIAMSARRRSTDHSNMNHILIRKSILNRLKETRKLRIKFCMLKRLKLKNKNNKNQK